jgi:type I restriction enzyme M protein
MMKECTGELLEFVDRQLFPALRNIDVSTGNRRALIVRGAFEGTTTTWKAESIFGVEQAERDGLLILQRPSLWELYESILKGLQSRKVGVSYTSCHYSFITEMINPQLVKKILGPRLVEQVDIWLVIEHLKLQAKNSVEERKSSWKT